MQTPEIGALRELINSASRKAQSTGTEVLASHTQLINQVDLIELFTAADDLTSDRWYWEYPEEDRAILSLGILTGTTPPRNIRFQEIDRHVRQYASSATVGSDAETGAPSPILFAGFSFDPRILQDRLVWQGFPSAYLLAPRLTFIRDGDRYTLTQNSVVSPKVDSDSFLEAACKFNEELVSALDTQKTSDLIVDELPPDKTNEKELRNFANAVMRGESAIREGEFEVLNIARRQKVTTGGLYRVNRALNYLRGRFPHARIVAAGRHGSTYIAYSPGVLASRTGDTVRSECTAGTIRRGETPELDRVLANQLCESPDELEHHELCVDQMYEAFESRCDDVTASEEPELRSTPDSHYLYSNAHGKLRPGNSLLDLVGTLHPTVAACGAPAGKALDFAREHEQTDRGWFASPFGWINLEGKGEFVAPESAVVIRSPVLEQQRAYLFTTNTVQSGADPEDHIAQSDRKLEPLRTAVRQ
jgi:isochorismate synthase EntC